MASSNKIIELHSPQPVTKPLCDDANDDIAKKPYEPNVSPVRTENEVAKGRAIIVIMQVTAITFLTSISTGLITVSIPRIAADLSIQPQLYYWPLSVYGLTSGSCLLAAGSVADVVGSRPVFLLGCFLLACFVLACGLARTGIQLIMFRAMQGIAVAMCLPTSVGILTNTVPSGRRRNIAVACMGLGQPLGFSLGLVLGGVFIDTIGWRAGWYMCAGAVLLCIFIGVWSIPKDLTTDKPSLTRLKSDIDWVGVIISTVCLALLAYALVMISTSASYVKSANVIATLAISLSLIPVFVMWVHRQERKKKPALVPNSLWKKLPFTSICLMVLLSYAVMQTMELFCGLFWQKVQNLSALQASIRFLPSMILAAVLNLVTGLIVDKVPVLYLTVITTALGMLAPLLMAIVSPKWPYWYAAFPAQLFEPLSPDVLFTVGLLVVSEVFPERTQALAGAVFNVVTQFGQSIGLAIVGVVSDSVTRNSKYTDKGSPSALLIGYRAGFWTCTGWTILACLIGAFGLRKSGGVGLKRD